MNFTDADEMFEFAIHGIDISNVNLDYPSAFQHEIKAIATDFRNDCALFDKTCTYLICGQTGQDFTGCLSLQDNEKVKQAYIRLCMAIGKFMNLIKKLNGNSQPLS